MTMGAELIDDGPQTEMAVHSPAADQAAANTIPTSIPNAHVAGPISRESVEYFVRPERLTASDVKLIQHLAALARTNPRIVMNFMEEVATPQFDAATVEASLEANRQAAGSGASTAQFLLDCMHAAQEVHRTKLEARFDAKGTARQQLVNINRYHELLRANHLANRGPYDASPSFRAIQYFTIGAVANMIASHRPDTAVQ